MSNPHAAVVVQINKEMCVSRDYRDILGFVAEYGSKFDLVNITTAMHRLGKLSRSSPSAMAGILGSRELRDLLKLVEERLHEMDGRQLANTGEGLGVWVGREGERLQGT